MNEEINLKTVIKNVHLYENPNFNFVALHYNPHSTIRHNGVELELKDVACDDEYHPLILIGNPRKILFLESMKVFAVLLIFNAIIALFTSGFITFQIITAFDLNYIKYIAIELAIASTVTSVAVNGCKLYFSKRLHKTDYLANTNYFDYSKKSKHSLADSKYLVKDIIIKSELCYPLNDDKLYNDKFFLNVLKTIEKVDITDNLKSKYLYSLNSFIDSSSLLKVVIFSLLSIAITIISVVEYFMIAGDFKNNLIVVSILIPLVSIFLPISLIGRKYHKACSKMTAYLMLFSYQYLS